MPAYITYMDPAGRPISNIHACLRLICVAVRANAVVAKLSAPKRASVQSYSHAVSGMPQDPAKGAIIRQTAKVPGTLGTREIVSSGCVHDLAALLRVSFECLPDCVPPNESFCPTPSPPLSSPFPHLSAPNPRSKI